MRWWKDASKPMLSRPTRERRTGRRVGTSSRSLLTGIPIDNDFPLMSRRKACAHHTPTQYQGEIESRSMSHKIKGKKDLIARIGRIRGQLNAVERALIEDKDCFQILQTVAACHGALNGLMAQILESHIRSHLLDTNPGR